MTTRFNNKTWNENKEFKKKYNYEGCIYGSPKPISSKIPIGIGLFVVEMNNELNRIEGIGYIHNTIHYEKYFEIYNPLESQHFNTYVFRGKTRVDREYIEQENIELLMILDYILFKEKTHLKRGSGLTRVPDKLFTSYNKKSNNNINIQNEIKILFQKYICHHQKPQQIKHQITIAKV